MWYELWDGDTGNRVGAYPTGGEALQAIVEDIARYGRESEAVLALGLLRRDPTGGDDALVAEGVSLAERALAAAMPARPLSAVAVSSRPKAKTPGR
jgi:hypothetical protein